MFKRESVGIKDILFWILFVGITVWVCVLCFYHLGEAGTHNWDEARHIINAYEMLKTRSWWIHSYRYETDYYNYKPPLSMWGIAACFRLFGVGFDTMRLYSAISMLLLFLVLSFFVLKNWGKCATLLTAVLLASGTDIYFFHMARSADADAIYMLMLTLAMVFLFEAEKKPWCLTVCSLFLSFAFMAKCLHAAIGAAVVVCYVPRLWKRLKWKHWISALLGGILPTGIWIIARICYDGFTFFRGMLKQEVLTRVEEEKNYFGYIGYFAGKPVIIFACVMLILAGIRRIIDRKNQNQGEKVSEKCAMLRKILQHPLYLLVLWLLIPFLVYSASGAFLEWYSYICYFPFCIIVAAVVSEEEKRAEGKSGWLPATMLILLLLGFGFSIREQIINLRTLKFINNTDLRTDVATLLERYPEYKGGRIYIENSRNEYCPQNVWEQNCIVDVYVLGDMEPVDGGVPLFAEDEDAVLIISKNLFESYSGVLAGRVILVDGNDYLIFNNEFYS